ncbi:MAG TPA: hypothetical protein VL403_16445 [Candidatus Kryptonia bacterium]|nr:hypothetical protein [Candidatus Kryptonia bacterium]
MLPIAPLLSNPIPQGIALTPGMAPVLVMLAFLVLGAGEVIRSVRAQRRARRSPSFARPLTTVSPRAAATAKRPLAA